MDNLLLTLVTFFPMQQWLHNELTDHWKSLQTQLEVAEGPQIYKLQGQIEGLKYVLEHIHKNDSKERLETYETTVCNYYGRSLRYWTGNYIKCFKKSP